MRFLLMKKGRKMLYRLFFRNTYQSFLKHTWNFFHKTLLSEPIFFENLTTISHLFCLVFQIKCKIQLFKLVLQLVHIDSFASCWQSSIPCSFRTYTDSHIQYITICLFPLKNAEKPLITFRLYEHHRYIAPRRVLRYFNY